MVTGVRIPGCFQFGTPVGGFHLFVRPHVLLRSSYVDHVLNGGHGVSHAGERPLLVHGLVPIGNRGLLHGVRGSVSWRQSEASDWRRFLAYMLDRDIRHPDFCVGNLNICGGNLDLWIGNLDFVLEMLIFFVHILCTFNEI